MQHIDNESDFKLIATAFTSQIRPALISLLKNPTITSLWMIAVFNASSAYFININPENIGGRYGKIIESDEQTRVIVENYLHWLISLTAAGFALVLMALQKINQNRP
jgi:hypothetical protein